MKIFTKINRELSKELAAKFETIENMCHYNSWKINLCIPELEYHLGFVFLDNEVAVHSWLVDENEMVVDPTLILNEKYLGECYIGVEKI